MFGKPWIIMPKKVEMVVRHLSASFSPPTPWMSILSKAPVMASKPVA